MIRPNPFLAIAAASLLAASSAHATTEPCNETFDSTFELIQQAIFDRNGCNSITCHSAASRAGGLDLSAAASYDNLVDAAVESVALRANVKRVFPAKKEDSLLWINLAAATLPDQWQAPLRSMPVGGLPPITLDELEVIRLWIESGAPQAGVVEGTGELLDACLPPPEPLETKPLAPPVAGTGVQLRAPTQIIPPHSESEVCFITPYDVTDQVPAMFRGEGDTFRYKRIEARQDPLSHHAVLVNYFGDTPLESPSWGPFICGGGERHGESCDPSNAAACGEGLCGSTPRPSVGCFGFGPGNAGIGLGNESLFNTMATGLGATTGVYAEAPLKGILVWNSHAFNVNDVDGKLDIWVNLEFAPPAEQEHQLRRFTVIDAMFGLDIPPYETREICGHHAISADARVIELSSHNHKRGVRFQTFEGAFRCQGGDNDGAPCSPITDDDDLGAPDLCAGAPCAARMPPGAGDCNGDLEVRVDEIVTGIGIALDLIPIVRCERADANGNGSVAVNEIVLAVRALLEPTLRDVAESTLYTSLSYADPAVTRFDPPLQLGDARSVDDERTFTFCGLYENGALDPATVKRQSTSPESVGGFPGGPCRTPVACAEGAVGRACSTDTDCDSSPGAGDGDCDACAVGFGTTTDDEMFILLGASFTEE